MTTREHLFRHLGPRWPVLLAIGALMVVLAATTAAYAWVAGPLLGALYGASGLELPALSGTAPSNPAEATMLLAGIVGIITIIRACARYGHDILLARLEEDVVLDLRRELHAHLLKLPALGPGGEQHGELAARVTQEVAGARTLLRLGVAGLTRNGLTAVALAVVAFRMDAVLAAVALVGLPFVAMTVHRLARRSRQAQRALLAANSRLSGGAAEAADLRSLVRAYDADDQARASYARHTRRARDAGVRSRRLQSLLGPLLDVVGGAAIIVALLVATARLESGQLTTDGAVSLFAALLLLYRPIQSLSSVVQGLASGLAFFDRMREVLERPTEREPAGGKPAPAVERGLELEDLRFGYGNRPVLDGVHLSVQPGESLAVVGLSGAGKTTLLLLLMGLLEPERGRVRADGVDLAEVDRSARRHLFAWVPQEPMLFVDTVVANITLGDDAPDLERAREAARAAGAHPFIERLPEGYDTLLEDRGQNLSAGERQRLCIARALYRDAPVLLLDEPTAALDGSAEEGLSETLGQLLGERMVILASHRESTVRLMDRVVVLADGRIVDEGPPTELAARSGPYKALFPDPPPDPEGRRPLRAVGDEP